MLAAYIYPYGQSKLLVVSQGQRIDAEDLACAVKSVADSILMLSHLSSSLFKGAAFLDKLRDRVQKMRILSLS